MTTVFSYKKIFKSDSSDIQQMAIASWFISFTPDTFWPILCQPELTLDKKFTSGSLPLSCVACITFCLLYSNYKSSKVWWSLSSFSGGRKITAAWTNCFSLAHLRRTMVIPSSSTCCWNDRQHGLSFFLPRYLYVCLTIYKQTHRGNLITFEMSKHWIFFNKD